MISSIFKVVLMLIIMVIVIPLQVVNVVVTTLQYWLTENTGSDLRGLFRENSKYILELIKVDQ